MEGRHTGYFTTSPRSVGNGNTVLVSYSLLGDLPLREWAAHNLIGKHHVKLVIAVDAPNYLRTLHAKSSPGGDVNNLLRFTILALYSHFDVACSGTGHFQCHDLRFLLPMPNPTRSKI
jgi:hypothetical protein